MVLALVASNGAGVGSVMGITSVAIALFLLTSILVMRILLRMTSKFTITLILIVLYYVIKRYIAFYYAILCSMMPLLKNLKTCKRCWAKIGIHR
mgnify:CR=1 FL=1